MSTDTKTQHAVGCAVTLCMPPAAARALAEELILLAREGDKQGKHVTFTIGGDASALEVADGE